MHVIVRLILHTESHDRLGKPLKSTEYKLYPLFYNHHMQFIDWRAGVISENIGFIPTTDDIYTTYV